MEDFDLKDKIKKLESLDKDQRLRLIWMWSKQNNIDFKQFKKLINLWDVTPVIKNL